MSSQVRVEIGGIGLLLRYKNCQIKEDKDNELYIRDFIQPGKNDFIIDIEVSRLPEYPKEKMLFQAKENWRSYIYNGNYIFETYQAHENEEIETGYLVNNSPRTIEIKAKNTALKVTRICVMEKDLPKAKAYISPDADTVYKGFNIKNSRTWSLEQLMKIMGQLITISILHRYQGLLIHSSGIIVNGEGIIFCGVSGTGKTTLAKLWQKRDRVIVLSDDRVIVRRQEQGYFVYGSPWPGEGKAVSCQKAPLKKIVFLFKAEQNKLTTLERKESFSQLITQCFPAIWDKESIDFALKFCAALVEALPCFSFGFVPEVSAVEFIEEKLLNC